MNDEEEIIYGGSLPGILITAPLTWKARNNIKARRGRQYVHEGRREAFPFVATAVGAPLAVTMAPLLAEGMYQAVPKVVEAMNVFNPSTLMGKGAYNTVLGSTGRSLAGATADAVVASTMGAEGIKLFKDNPSLKTGVEATLANIPTIAGASKAVRAGLQKFPKVLDKSIIGKLSRLYTGFNPSKIFNLVSNPYYSTSHNDLRDYEYKYQNLKDNFRFTLYDYENNIENLRKAINNVININKKTKDFELEFLKLQQRYDKYQSYQDYRYHFIQPLLRGIKIPNTLKTRKNPDIDFSKITQKDYQKLLKLYPQIFKEAVANSSSLKSGNIEVPIFGTDIKQKFDIPSAGLELKFKEGKGVYYTPILNLTKAPKEYQDLLIRNIKYILDKFPGWKPFGSSVLASKGLPHGTHDFDGMMTEEAYNKWKSALSPELLNKLQTIVEGETYRYPLEGGKYGEAGDIDINILKIDPKTGKGNKRATELFRQFYPDAYELLGLTLADRDMLDDTRFIPIINNNKVLTSQELLDSMDPVIKTIMDSQESLKPKHIGRAPFIITSVDPEMIHKANQLSANMLFGKNYMLLPNNVNMGTVQDRIQALTDIGMSKNLANAVAKNPQITKNFIELYMLTNPKLFRASNAGDINENSGTIEKLKRNFFSYNPNPSGGDYSGKGINYTVNGDSGHSRAYIASIQPTEDFRNILYEGINIKDIVPTLQKYFNLNDGFIYKNNDEFINFLQTPFEINGKFIKPFGFTGYDYGTLGALYFGAGPIDPNRVSSRIFISPEVSGGFLGYYRKLRFNKYDTPEINQYLRHNAIQNKQYEYKAGIKKSIKDLYDRAVSRIVGDPEILLKKYDLLLNDRYRNKAIKENAGNILLFEKILYKNKLDQILNSQKNNLNDLKSLIKEVTQYKSESNYHNKVLTLRNLLNKINNISKKVIFGTIGLGSLAGINSAMNNTKHKRLGKQAYFDWFDNSIYSDLFKNESRPYYLNILNNEFNHKLYNLYTKDPKLAEKFVRVTINNYNLDYDNNIKLLLKEVVNIPLYRRLKNLKKTNKNLYDYMNNDKLLLQAIKNKDIRKFNNIYYKLLKSYSKKI